MKLPTRPIKHKLAEDTLSASEKRYRSLFDNMLNGVGHVQLIFDGDCTLTGLTNVVGKRVTEVILGIREIDPRAFEICDRVARTGVPEFFEHWSEVPKACLTAGIR